MATNNRSFFSGNSNMPPVTGGVVVKPALPNASFAPVDVIGAVTQPVPPIAAPITPVLPVISNSVVMGTRRADDIDLSNSHHGSTILALEGDDMVMGSQGDDLIFAGEGNDTVYGNKGDDVIFGGEGDDTLSGGIGNDIIRGGEGNDVIMGDEGDDRLYGGMGDDKISGGEGNDRLYGGMGDDYIDGGAGTDEMTGGEGSDMFVFNVDSGVVNIVANPLDGIITDFKDGVDKIMVSDASGGNLSFTDLSITQVGSSVLVTLSSNGDSIEIQNFDAANLDANDFVF